MRLRVLLVGPVLALAAFGAAAPVGVAAAATPPTTEAPADTVPTSTLNDFIPTERDISDCISAVQKPGCGSENRSDYHMWLVFIALIGGMALIAWRIVVGYRRDRATIEEPTTTTPQPQA